MRKILIGICMLFLGCIIIYFNDGFKIMDEVVKSEDILPIQNILVEDFFGTIEIKKTNRDNIIKSDNVEIKNINGSLKISNKRKKWFNFGSTNSKVVIEYSNDMLDIDVVDVVGDVSIEMPQISNLNIVDVVGDINVKSNGVVDIIDSEDVLGKVSLKNVIKDYNSSQKISVRDLVGDINIF
jgi:lipoprotein